MEDWSSRNKRKQVFEEELHSLKEKNYIDEQDYHKINYAYNLYLKDLDEQRQKIKVSFQKQIISKEKTKPVKTQKTKTAEQIRERNISWLLILGVILLFIGGLVFGTSNWSSMSNPVKVILVSLVSGVFFGSSYFAEKYLKIKKTSFAFMTLGSLFLPISIISIGYFELLGNWLSINGEGKYLLGLLGSLVCLLLYTYIASKYEHRLFVWFSYLTSTIGVGFLLAMTYLPRDFFYFGIMIYNGLLLFSYYKLKENNKYELFTKELPVYAQLNLIVSTLLLLFFFENAVFYSFNILLTATLYISMVFVNKIKHYHYIFTLMFVYGMYQLIENSFLKSVDYIGMALIGLLYLVFQQFTKEDTYIQRIFQISSGIVSFCAFIFISIQGVLLRSDENSIILLLAYLIIAINYIFLSNMANQRIFRYLAPFFLLTAGYQSYFIFFKNNEGNYIELYMFTIATILFVTFYLKNHFKYISNMKRSSFMVSIGAMLLTIFSTIVRGETTHTSLLLFVFGFIALIIYRDAMNDNVKKITAWVNPISWGLSFIIFFEYADLNFLFYRNHVELMGHLAIGGLLLIATSYFWKSKNQQVLDLNTFLIATGVYTISMLTTPLEGYDHPIMSSIIYFIGIGIYTLLVYKTKLNILWILSSITSVAFLLSLINVLGMKNSPTWLTLYTLFVPIILLLIYKYIGRKIKGLKPYFFWTAHVYLLPVFLFSIFQVFYARLHPALLLIAVIPYVYSTVNQTQEWAKKLFLYGAFTTLPFIVYLHIHFYDLGHVFSGEHLFLIVTGIIATLWLSVKEQWKKRIDWYLIPQALLGLVIFISFMNDDKVVKLLLFIAYTIFTLFLLHRRNWQLYTIIPLLLVAVYLTEYLSFIEKSMKIGLFLLIFFALHLFGKFFYKEIYRAKPLLLDWYTITSSHYILMLFVIISGEDPIWLKLIPSLLVVYFFFSLNNKFSTVFERRIVKTVTAISILLPYYTILLEFNINQYIVMELYLLPFIILAILLSKKTWKDYKKIMYFIQWIVLLIVTFILVTDALNSNTIYDAMIVGILSLVSILGGIQFRIKSYFFVGIGVLLLNVLLQTRPYWGNLPWWGYLIVAGLTLMGFASFYEFQKQKKDSDKKSFLQIKKEQILRKFRDWE